VTGLQFAYLAVLKGGQHYFHQLIERDEEIIEYLVQIEGDFWRLVEAGTPPALDGSESSAEVLRHLYPESIPGSTIALPPTAADLIEQYERAKAEAAEATERMETAANQLKALLGENEVGLLGERRVTWKTITSSRLDAKGLRADLPDIYAKYARESVSRRFEIR
ncbi:MAG TPA: hypothetical protein GXX28_12565, partial [Firmicutes bacterium]|nr:hypothetical protein [Bacillota bacterium]